MRPSTFAALLFICQVVMMASGAWWTFLCTHEAVGAAGRRWSILVTVVMTVTNAAGAVLAHHRLLGGK